MRRRMLALAFVAMTAITVLIPTFATAASLDEGVILDESQRTARGRFHFERGCIETYISLTVNHQQQEWIDGSTLDQKFGGVFIDQYNHCTEEPVVGVEYYDEELAAHVSHNLTGASLNDRLTLTNIIGEGNQVKLSINAYWVPAGRLNAVEEVSEITATLPGGEEVPAIEYFTELDRRAIALGVVTINGEIFPLFGTGEDGELYGYNGKWTMAPAQN